MEFYINYPTWSLQLYQVVPEHLDRRGKQRTHDPSYTVYKVCHKAGFRRKVNDGRIYPRQLLRAVKYWKPIWKNHSLPMYTPIFWQCLPQGIRILFLFAWVMYLQVFYKKTCIILVILSNYIYTFLELSVIFSRQSHTHTHTQSSMLATQHLQVNKRKMWYTPSVQHLIALYSQN